MSKNHPSGQAQDLQRQSGPRLQGQHGMEREALIPRMTGVLTTGVAEGWLSTSMAVHGIVAASHASEQMDGSMTTTATSCIMTRPSNAHSTEIVMTMKKMRNLTLEKGLGIIHIPPRTIHPIDPAVQQQHITGTQADGTTRGRAYVNLTKTV